MPTDIPISLSYGNVSYFIFYYFNLFPKSWDGLNTVCKRQIKCFVYYLTWRTWLPSFPGRGNGICDSCFSVFLSLLVGISTCICGCNCEQWASDVFLSPCSDFHSRIVSVFNALPTVQGSQPFSISFQLCPLCTDISLYSLNLTDMTDMFQLDSSSSASLLLPLSQLFEM